MSRNNALIEELEALKSIYDKDLRCDGSEIVITLFPLQEKEKKEVYVQVDLSIFCSASYPEKEPGLSLKNVKGLSDAQIENLYHGLKELTKSLRGEVMIYNLAYYIQEFLTENNRPGKKSCYEEMILRKEQQKQEEYQSEVHKKTKLMKDIEKRQKEMLELDECDSSEDDETEKSNFYASRSSKSRSGSIMQNGCSLSEHKSCRYIQFQNKILRGCCIEHGVSSTVYCALDSTSGNQLLLQEWILKPINKDSVSVIQQNLENIQNELGNLKKLHHENLISYVDMKYSFDKGECNVQFLQEYHTNFSLSVFIQKNLDLDLNFVREVIYGVLNALDYLHINGFVHGCVNETNIYITKLGIIKIANYTIKNYMDTLSSSCNNVEFSLEKEKISQKSDILEVGNLILKIMRISSIPDENIVVPDFQPLELKEFVEKCLIENEAGRWTARKLLNHKFLKTKENRQIKSMKKLSICENNVNVTAEEIEKPFDMFFEESQIVNSRLAKEFKILTHIGTGSFGTVLKVKNKLDGSVYAIKVIRLNMNNKQLDKKMIREVKLLSKLNHENVVRYYTSWIEADSGLVKHSSENGGSDEVDMTADQKINKSSMSQLKLDEDDDDDEEDDEDDDDEEEEIDSGVNPSENYERKGDDSSYIVFLNEHGNMPVVQMDCLPNLDTSRQSDIVEANRTMYIQMEFCEKSTLRISINDTNVKLCEDQSRLWRLFREIVEGLAYVHGQGMIHRDLKPENIFLDSSDHVKIGDFGLATISVVSKSYLGASLGAGDNETFSQHTYDDYHTGKVGTSLYVAPELDKSYGKSYYNKKVDIYSLGIIFFEMCNGPFGTDMERIETILNLRKCEIIFSPFWKEKLSSQMNLVKMLLNHDPKSRPSCQEILEGNYLPPAEFEYEELQEIMRQTLINSKSKAYKYLISSCFEQEVRIEEDITYQWENVRSEKHHFLLDTVKERIENILKKHGAVYLSAPLLLPQNKVYGKVEARVQLMTHSGSIVNLPYDLRTPFARYVAWKASRFTRFRRYVLERVYREKRVHGLHPKEQYECAFDLVTPNSSIENAEMEIFCVIQELINDFKSLKNRNCVIRLNHSLLLRALLMHFNLEKRYDDIFKVLSDSRENKYFNSKLNSNLQQIGVQNVNALLNLFLKEDSISNIKKELSVIINKRGKPLDMINEGFQKLNAIIMKAERWGIKMPIKIALGVVCNSEHCSDIMFDVSYQLKQKRKKDGCVSLMWGCRYDKLIANFRKLFELTSANLEDELPSAVGLSVSIDKIMSVLKEDNILSEYVVVCSFENSVLARTKESMAKKLWESGIKCYVEQNIETLEDLTDYCRENKITHIVNMKDEESGFAYVMTWDDDRSHFVEKKINIRDITEHLRNTKMNEGYSSPSYSRQSSEVQGRIGGTDVLNGNQSTNIQIISDEKLTTTQRKRLENQIRSRISSVVGVFSSRARLEIIGVHLDEPKIKDIALNFKTSNSSNIESITDRNPMKKYILKICDKLRSLCEENFNTVIILYSLPQDKLQIVVDC